MGSRLSIFVVFFYVVWTCSTGLGLRSDALSVWLSVYLRRVSIMAQDNSKVEMPCPLRVFVCLLCSMTCTDDHSLEELVYRGGSVFPSCSYFLPAGRLGKIYRYLVESTVCIVFEV